MQGEEPVVQVEELVETQQSFFYSPLLTQSYSTSHLNSSQLPHLNEPQRLLQVSAIQSPLAPQSPVHIVGSSDDDIIFVEAVAAPAAPARRRRRSFNSS